KAGKNVKKPDIDFANDAQRQALLNAQEAADKQAIKDKLAAEKSGLDQADELNNEFFAKGLIDLEEFFGARINIAKESTQKEIDALQAEHDKLVALPKPTTAAEDVKRTADEKSLLSQIDTIRTQGQNKVLNLLQQELDARKRIHDQVLGFQEQLLNAQGQQFQAAKIGITKQVNDFILALQQETGHSTEEIQTQAQALRNILTLQAQFTQAQNRANQETTSLDLARQAVQSKVAQGLISERDGQLQIAAIERQRLPTLENLADQMDKFAKDANRPDLAQAAEQFRASFAGIGVVVDESTKKLRELKASLLSDVQGGLSQFLGVTISQVHSLTEAFGSLIASIAQSIQQTLGDLIASKAIDAVRHLLDHTQPVAPEVASATATSVS
ncbi:MAG: hypothetical protein LUO93_10315, partial [Methanomicrobiales archaeon]|nr:hypothetical protein [Methanomicrobiales archaeon]